MSTSFELRDCRGPALWRTFLTFSQVCLSCVLSKKLGESSPTKPKSRCSEGGSLLGRTGYLFIP